MIVTLFLVAAMGILGCGLLSWAKMAMLLADRGEIGARREGGSRWATKAAAAMDRPDRLFGASRIGVELIHLAAGAIVLVSTWAAWGAAWSILCAAAIIIAMLILGELFPQALAARRPFRRAPAMTWILVFAQWVLFPWIWTQRAAAALGSRSTGGENPGEPPFVTRQELAWLIRGEEDGGELLREERKMIDRIFHFSETQVREVMIPLIEVRAVEENAEVGEVIRMVDNEGYSRFPVYSGRIDRIRGIIHSFDLLETPSLEEPVGHYLRRAPFVPESMPVDELLLQLQRDGDHMAIVVDEYGGSVGIVTMEDLLEEIVGEIQDEHDIQKVLYRKISAHQFLVSARMEIDQLNGVLGTSLPKEDYETLGGFLLKAFRRIPAERETLLYEGVHFSVQKADERSIQEVLITLPRRPSADGLRGEP